MGFVPMVFINILALEPRDFLLYYVAGNSPKGAAMESVVETLEDLAVLIKMKVRKFLRRGDEITVTYTKRGGSVVFWVDVVEDKKKYIIGRGGVNIKAIEGLVQNHQARFGLFFYVKVTPAN